MLRQRPLALFQWMVLMRENLSSVDMETCQQHLETYLAIQWMPFWPGTMRPSSHLRARNPSRQFVHPEQEFTSDCFHSRTSPSTRPLARCQTTRSAAPMLCCSAGAKRMHLSAALEHRTPKADGRIPSRANSEPISIEAFCICFCRCGPSQRMPE
ncbi:hypothetical protein MPTK1_2g23880 [Marchantia polymorpha subsp. ruderalis]|uniref:Uncharacterized protein n=1 Tax=Marchantia polymorpha TaxID=3197 RepID=A0A2R6WPE3_MARPO|nr:hypothetical protein MARPO_0069s0038 [Marchantia polymorpha]BBN03486.1 hypothetical protein Mp_2g23880 [Marchantia polymorpha subsp. ruderalis]|eukprot:PTQ35693.1 hypothetical protein MARPO_0069s0038 [Marchantia polymorpha]